MNHITTLLKTSQIAAASLVFGLVRAYRHPAPLITHWNTKP
jgi:hypothetical protein